MNTEAVHFINFHKWFEADKPSTYVAWTDELDLCSKELTINSTYAHITFTLNVRMRAHTHTHTHTGIPGHEFPQPRDMVVRGGGSVTSGGGRLTSGEVQFFQNSTFLMVGLIPVQFGMLL